MTDLRPGAVAERERKKLSRAELKKFTFCETTIAKGVASIGAAFQTIRDEKLYREQYSSFDAYCREVWGLTRRTIDRRIKFELVVAEAETDRSQPPKNEWQSRHQTTKPALANQSTSTATGQARVDPTTVQDGLRLNRVKAEIDGGPIEAEIEDGVWTPMKVELPESTVLLKKPDAAALVAMANAFIEAIEQWKSDGGGFDNTLADALSRVAKRATEELKAIRLIKQLEQKTRST
jgi:hypothetical protein